MRTLVTGALGFVGQHVVSELAQAGHTPVLADTVSREETGHEFHQLDITDAPALDELVRKARPDACIHLAGIAFVPMGWTNPHLVFSVNTEGAINVLESFRHHAPDAPILLVSSAELYGRNERDHAIHEDSPPAPDNPYALSKMAADLTGLLYAKQYGMRVMTARPQNHIGPGQSQDFVIPSFAHQVLEISKGRADATMRVGNLESERDFTDVRDVARAYRLLVERGTAGEAYNIASGHTVTIQSILDQLCAAIGVEPHIEIDPERFRPTDRTPAIDIAKIAAHVGWKPEIMLPETVDAIVSDLKTRAE